ncbi:MAG: hypothetical protein K2L02_01870, partial [Clostridia bacterium]|nr:hypothetical protein [Clostridia bacterium]
MKKHFRKTFMIVTALLFALPLLFLVACAVKPRSETDVIPDTYGTSEGLWLYKGNKRSRTDGMEEEKLLTSVTVGETEYGVEDFKIISYMYVKDTWEIFYIIQIDTDCRLCHYNYKTKESSDLYDLWDTETPENYFIEVSDSLVYVADQVIFSHDAELLYKDFRYGTLDGNIVYDITGREFKYFMNGEMHVVPLDATFPNSEDAYQRYGNYFYLIGSDFYAINLDTEECTTLSVFSVSKNMYRSYDDFYYMDGSLFVLTKCCPRYSSNADERFYQLIRVTGASTSVAYDFGDAPYGMTMYIDGSTIYLVKQAARSIHNQYFAYDSKTGKTESVSSKAVKNGKTTADLTKVEKINDNDRELTVGEYTFYVYSIGYDDVSDMFGSHYSKTCYYLMRRHGGLEEVMQYSL